MESVSKIQWDQTKARARILAGYAAKSEGHHSWGHLDSKKSHSLRSLHWITLSELPEYCFLSV